MTKKATGRTRSNRRTSLAGKYSKKKTKSAGRRSVIFICLTVIMIAVGITLGCIYIANTDQDGTILENVSVAGVHVGGMTQVQAIQAVQAATKNTYTQKSMVVTVADTQIEINPADSGAKLNVKAAVKAAYKYGRTGTAARQKSEQETALNSGYAVDLSKYLNLKSDTIRELLSEFGAVYNTTLTQSTYEVTGTKPDQILVINLGVPEYGLDLDELYQQVLDAYNRNVFSVTGESGIIAPDPIDLEGILSQYYIAPVDATFDTHTNEIVDGTDGYGFDIDAAKKLLETAKGGTRVEIPFTAIKPEITADILSARLYKNTLSTYTASYTSDPDRDTNLRLACEAINGFILNPGDVFSYNSTLGERTAARGYKLGNSYQGDETVKTIGGGICQVSSTLYYCALMADMEILVRNAHGFAPAYVPLGMDATVSWGSLDFRFRNNTDYPIRIDASASGGSTTVSLVGTDVKDYYVKMEYEVLSTYKYSLSHKTLSADNPEGYRNDDYIVEPFTGYDVETYRCKYNKETDALISQDLEDTSNYRKRDGVICKIEGTSSNGQGSSSLPGIGNGGVTDEGGSLPELP